MRKKFRTGMIMLIGTCVLALSGCGKKTVAGTENDITTSEEITSEEGTEEALSYMERFAGLIKEKADRTATTKAIGVKYPEFQEYKYYSNTAERETPVNVLLPVDYSEDKEYPVLYILHGYWDDQNWMTRDVVKINTMYQNLVNSGEAKEMIIVCPYIYCSKDMPACTGMDTTNTLNYDNFINDMLTDLMPFIESKFSVAKGKDNTAITGFSMGGRESLFIGFKNPDKFGYIGAVCPAPGVIKGTGTPYNLELSEFVFGEEKPYLLMISASTTDGVVGNNPEIYHKRLESTNVEHIWHQIKGTGHDASSVTPHLYNFMRVIFQ